MKRLFCFSLTAALIVSIVACEEAAKPAGAPELTTRTTETTETTVTTAATTAPEPVGEPIEGSRISAAFDLIELETFSYEVVMTVAEEELPRLGIGATTLFIYRDRNNLYVEFLGQSVAHILDSKLIDLDPDKEIAYYSELSEQQLESILESWTNQGAASAWIDLDGARLLGTGTAEFKGKELFYEEIKDGRGSKAQAFFDDDGLVGLLTESANGEYSEIEFRISASVPEGIFDIPEDYELVERQ